MNLVCALIILTGYTSLPLNTLPCRSLCEDHEGLHVVIRTKALDKLYCICNNGKTMWATTDNKIVTP